MSEPPTELIPLNQRIEKLRGSIGFDAALQVGGSAATALASIGGPIPAVVSAGLFGFAVFLRGHAGQRRMLEALESICKLVNEHQQRLDGLKHSDVELLTDIAESQIAKFLELSAREGSQEKIRAARNFLQQKLKQGPDTASLSTIDEEFERWLAEATTLEIRCVMVLREAGKTSDVLQRHSEGSHPTISTLPKFLECNRDTAKRIVERLASTHVVEAVRQVAKGSTIHLEGAITAAYALTELGVEFQRRMQ